MAEVYKACLLRHMPCCLIVKREWHPNDMACLLRHTPYALLGSSSLQECVKTVTIIVWAKNVLCMNISIVS